MTDRPNSRYRADTDVNQINQTKLSHTIPISQVHVIRLYKAMRTGAVTNTGFLAGFGFECSKYSRDDKIVNNSVPEPQPQHSDKQRENAG